MKKSDMLLIIVLSLISGLTMAGQDLPGSNAKGSTTDSNYSNVFVYLHSDRSYYLPGESVYFKAYFLDNLNNRSFPTDDTLNVAILDQQGFEVTSGRFPVTNNLISGNIDLPDILTEGNYLLIASTILTNNHSPEKMFSKVIEIRKFSDINLITRLSLKDTVYEPGGLLSAQVMLSGKDNKPVTSGFTYQLAGTSGEILNGKGKTNEQGMATLSLKLPEFDNKEELVLLVVPSYKGNKTTTGVVIPTHFNHSGKEMSATSNLSGNKFKHLTIQLKTIQLSGGNHGKTQLDLSVTAEDGTPVMANLSVSASNLLPYQTSSKNENIVDYINHKSNTSEANTSMDTGKYFTQFLMQVTRAPGIPFIVQEKNNIKKLRKKEDFVNQKNQQGYSTDRNIFDILMQIKPYHMADNRIFFGAGSVSTVSNLDGALIIVDGIKMGSDASILSTIPVPDIAKITASTNILDIQRYSAMNNTGIIEITMKKTDEFLKNEQIAGKNKSNTLFWGQDVMTDSSGKASVSFFNNENSSEIFISVEGIAANGVCGSSSIHYSTR